MFAKCTTLPGILLAALAIWPADAAAQPAPALGTVTEITDTAAQAPAVDMPSTCCAKCPRIWIGTECLIWWIKDGSIDTPMVTTGSTTLSTRTTIAGIVGPPVNFPFTQGGLGVPGTSTLYGASGLDYGTLSGIRLNAGGWFNDDATVGLDTSSFILQQGSNQFSVTSNGTPFLAIPVQDTAQFGVPFAAIHVPSGQTAFPITSPGFVTSVTALSQSQLWSSEANGICNVYRQNGCTINLLAGFRYVDLNETLQFGIIKASAATSGAIQDYWGAHNQIYGGQMGVKAERMFGRLFVNGSAKFLIGDNRETVAISGTTPFSLPGPNPIVSSVGGTTNSTVSLTAGGAAKTWNNFPILVGPNNSGVFHHDQVVVIPDLQLNVGYQITQGIRGYVGYNFIYISNVVRPGDQVSTQTDSLATGPKATSAFPASPVPLGTTDFWAHGLSVGLELRY
jgi:hypothetical protein